MADSDGDGLLSRADFFKILSRPPDFDSDLDDDVDI